MLIGLMQSVNSLGSGDVNTGVVGMVVVTSPLSL